MAGTDTQVNIRGFRGINLDSHARTLDDAELVEALNFDIEKAGELVKRKGVVRIDSGGTLGDNSTRILGHFLTSTYSQLIVKAGNNVYYSGDGISYTLLGAYSDAEFGVQYNSKFYIIRSGNEIVEWTGAAASNIAGSPSGTFAIIHKERMFVLNSIASGSLNSRYYFSLAGDVTATGWIGTNFIDVQPGDGDFLVTMAIVQDLLLIFKGKTTWALYVQGTTNDWVQRNISMEVGCISKYATRLARDYLYLSCETGIYRTDGASFEKVSNNLDAVLEDRIVNLTTYNQDAIAFWEDKLICLVSPDASTRRYFVYHFSTEGWTEWEFANSLQPRTFLEIRTNNPQVGLYMGDFASNGKIVRLGDDVYSDNGSQYTCRVRTKQYDLGTPNNMKRGKWLGLELLGLATMNWSHEVDESEVSSGAVTVEALTRQVKIPGPGYFRTWLFEFDFTTATAFTFFGITLQASGKRTVIKART